MSSGIEQIIERISTTNVRKASKRPFSGNIADETQAEKRARLIAELLEEDVTKFVNDKLNEVKNIVCGSIDTNPSDATGGATGGKNCTVVQSSAYNDLPGTSQDIQILTPTTSKSNAIGTVTTLQKRPHSSPTIKTKGDAKKSRVQSEDNLNKPKIFVDGRELSLDSSSETESSDESVIMYDEESSTKNVGADGMPNNLDAMDHIIFLDLDNWFSFFQKLPMCLPHKTFVWAFYGGGTQWVEPRCEAFRAIKSENCFFLHKKCGRRKDAADFALCLWLGRMDERLPKRIPFTILSGDQGFREVEEQMKTFVDRRTVVVDPHHQSPEDVYGMLLSVAYV